MDADSTHPYNAFRSLTTHVRLTCTNLLKEKRVYRDQNRTDAKNLISSVSLTLHDLLPRILLQIDTLLYFTPLYSTPLSVSVFGSTALPRSSTSSTSAFSFYLSQMNLLHIFSDKISGVSVNQCHTVYRISCPPTPHRY